VRSCAKRCASSNGSYTDEDVEGAAEDEQAVEPVIEEVEECRDVLDVSEDVDERRVFIAGTDMFSICIRSRKDGPDTVGRRQRQRTFVGAGIVGSRWRVRTWCARKRNATAQLIDGGGGGR
jgi:hypothetical protein